MSFFYSFDTNKSKYSFKKTVDEVPWDVEEFFFAKDKGTFPNPNFGFIDKPAIFVDSKGRIVIWYLPGILLPPRQVWAYLLD